MLCETNFTRIYSPRVMPYSYSSSFCTRTATVRWLLMVKRAHPPQDVYIITMSCVYRVEVCLVHDTGRTRRRGKTHCSGTPCTAKHRCVCVLKRTYSCTRVGGCYRISTLISRVVTGCCCCCCSYKPTEITVI